MKNEIKEISVSDIKCLPTNPGSRIKIDSEAMQDLIEFIRGRIDSGKYPLPPTDRLLIGNDGYLGDGHRRLAALKHLGINVIEVEIDAERSGAEIWRDRASGRPLTSRNVSESARLGLPMYLFPKRQRYNAERIIHSCGEDGLKLVIKTGTSFGVIHVVDMVLHFLDDRKITGGEILRWVIKHKMQRFARNAMEYNLITTDGLLRKIKADRPLKVS